MKTYYYYCIIIIIIEGKLLLKILKAIGVYVLLLMISIINDNWLLIHD